MGIALNFSHKTRSAAVEVAGKSHTRTKGLTLPLSTALGCTLFPLAAAAVWLVSGSV
jgi:hypothetical protein